MQAKHLGPRDTHPEPATHRVLSDITGTSGQAILDAILSGRRDPVELAQLCHRRVQSPRGKVAQALVGDYRPKHLFTLKQSLAGYPYYQKLILELDQEKICFAMSRSGEMGVLFIAVFEVKKEIRGETSCACFSLQREGSMHRGKTRAWDDRR